MQSVRPKSKKCNAEDGWVKVDVKTKNYRMQKSKRPKTGSEGHTCFVA